MKLLLALLNRSGACNASTAAAFQFHWPGAMSSMFVNAKADSFIGGLLSMLKPEDEYRLSSGGSPRHARTAECECRTRFGLSDVAVVEVRGGDSGVADPERCRTRCFTGSESESSRSDMSWP